MAVARLAAALLAASAASALPATAQAPPFSFAEADFTPDCAPNTALERLLMVLVPRAAAESDGAQLAFDEPLFNAISGHTSRALVLSEAKDWHGLHLAEVRLVLGIESGPANYTLAFADSPERVRAVWNDRGWQLPPTGETRVIDDEAIRTAVGIEADGELALVTCFHD